MTVRRRLDVGRHSEVPADQETLAFGDVVLRVVVGDAVLEAWVVDADLRAVSRQVEVEEIATRRERCRGSDEEVAFELRAEGTSLDEPDRRGRHRPLPGELG